MSSYRQEDIRSSFWLDVVVARRCSTNSKFTADEEELSLPSNKGQVKGEVALVVFDWRRVEVGNL